MSVTTFPGTAIESGAADPCDCCSHDSSVKVKMLRFFFLGRKLLILKKDNWHKIYKKKKRITIKTPSESHLNQNIFLLSYLSNALSCNSLYMSNTFAHSTQRTSTYGVQTLRRAGIVAAKYLHQPHYQCVCRTPAVPGFLLFKRDNLSEPTPPPSPTRAAITPRSEGVCQLCIPTRGGGGGEGLAGPHASWRTVFMEVKRKQTNKGVCGQEALITATAIRVMRPDGRTV